MLFCFKVINEWLSEEISQENKEVCNIGYAEEGWCQEYKNKDE